MLSLALWSTRVTLATVFLAAVACSEPEPDAMPRWEVVMSELPSALLSVWGTSESDIWTVGSDASGTGPLVLHYDGSSWARRETGARGDLWWVFGVPGGAVYMGGAGGLILRYKDGVFTKMPTPGTGTVFGIWGTSERNIWAVGGATGGASGAFAWRLEGDAWVEAPEFPRALAESASIWKMFGRAANDAWLVGTFGKALHWDGTKFTADDTGIAESLFTVHANAERFVAVGGYGSGTILENDGRGWISVTPSRAPALNGVCVTDAGGYAVGFDGTIYVRDASGWKQEPTALEVYETLHAVWIDPRGDVWAVGGQVSAFPLVSGVMIHRMQEERK